MGLSSHLTVCPCVLGFSRPFSPPDFSETAGPAEPGRPADGLRKSVFGKYVSADLLRSRRRPLPVRNWISISGPEYVSVPDPGPPGCHRPGKSHPGFAGRPAVPGERRVPKAFIGGSRPSESRPWRLPAGGNRPEGSRPGKTVLEVSSPAESRPWGLPAWVSRPAESRPWGLPASGSLPGSAVREKAFLGTVVRRKICLGCRPAGKPCPWGLPA
jgi:hypothetical protein